MRKPLWPLALGALLAACAPRITMEPVPGVRVDVPVQVPAPTPPPGGTPQPSGQTSGGVAAPVIKVLPGNPLPPLGSVFADDFSSYPLGAVLPVVAPDLYGLLRTGREWQKITVEQAFTPDGRLDKAVRMEGGGERDTGFLTTGDKDWTDYRVSFRLKTLRGDQYIRARLFLDGAGSRGLEFAIGALYAEGVKLFKLAGDQSFLLLHRKELEPTARAVLFDQNWHDFAFELRSDGTVKVFVDNTEVLSWRDPDYNQGGFGIGPVNVTFQLDDFKVERLGGGGRTSR